MLIAVPSIMGRAVNVIVFAYCAASSELKTSSYIDGRPGLGVGFRMGVELLQRGEYAAWFEMGGGVVWDWGQGGGVEFLQRGIGGWAWG